jgi:hypothetical protein
MVDRPKRIQLRRTKGWRMPEGAVVCTRPGGRGNPFAHRDPAIAKRMFRAWLLGTCRGSDLLDCRVVLGDLEGRRAAILATMEDLRGKDLACWCAPTFDCHVDVLLELANAPLRCDDGSNDDHNCPNCGGEGEVWGCFEDTCVCDDDDGLGCAPSRCDWCSSKK